MVQAVVAKLVNSKNMRDPMPPGDDYALYHSSEPMDLERVERIKRDAHKRLEEYKDTPDDQMMWFVTEARHGRFERRGQHENLLKMRDLREIWERAASGNFENDDLDLAARAFTLIVRASENKIKEYNEKYGKVKKEGGE